MEKRFFVIWFPFLKTDWIYKSQAHVLPPGSYDKRSSITDYRLPTVLLAPVNNKMIITGTNETAKKRGLYPGMRLADARTIVPDLKSYNDIPGLAEKLLRKIAIYCIRFSPIVSIDPPDNIIIDATGCTQLWNGEENYRYAIIKRLNETGYTVQAEIADTIGAAWALTHFGTIRDTGYGEREKNESLNSETPFSHLPIASLRIDPGTIDRLHKLGLQTISQILPFPRHVLRKRFGNHLLLHLDQALGKAEEIIQPVHPPCPYEERLPCLEPIKTATGIEIAIKNLLEHLCKRLKTEGKGIRNARVKAFRIDNKTEQIEIGTTRASNDPVHLFKLLELKIEAIEPALGIELFLLQAIQVEKINTTQQKLWETASGFNNNNLVELLDRVINKLGSNVIHRYLPVEKHWPERSIKSTNSLTDMPATEWRIDRLRPVTLLSTPEPILVTAPIPDYPPMNFRYKNKLHVITKADGPERIEPEWWIDMFSTNSLIASREKGDPAPELVEEASQGRLRDYYTVEDEEGKRYWLFRSGHYDSKNYKWYLHGFFA